MKKTLLYSPYTVCRERLPLNYDELEGKEHFIIKEYKYGATYLYELENAFVTPYGGVYQGFQVVKEAVYSMHWHLYSNKKHYLSLFRKILSGGIVRVSGISVVGTHSWFDNYYHFTVECLPRLFAIKDFAPQARLLLHADAPSFVKEYIRLLGFENIIFLKANQLALAEKLLLPMHTADGHNHNEELIRMVAAWLKAKANSTSINIRASKNIYVSRRKAKYRKLLNEEEVVSLVKNYGFDIVYLEDYSVIEQISILGRVKNFIAVHGAGTTNIMFMGKGGLVIELIHEEHYQPCFYNLANAFELDTVYIQGKGTSNSQDPIHDDFSIDIDKLKYHLEINLR